MKSQAGFTARAAVGAAAGALAWTFTEYASHRWLLHGDHDLKGVPLGSVHRNHHRDPNHSVTLARALAHVGVALSTATALSAVSRLLPTAPRAFLGAAGATFSLGYSAYDIVHHRLHHVAPSTDRGTKLRQRHLRHHYQSPHANLGVTSGLWDRLLGTEARGGPVKVPQRHAPDWIDQLGTGFRA